MENGYIWDYLNPYQYMEKVRKGMPPLIITAAITGSAQGKEANPNHPETIDEQVEEAYNCYKAGASVIHIHCRDKENTANTTKYTADYLEVNSRIRERCPDVIINNTTGGSYMLTSEERMCSVFAKPEMASLNCGPFMLNFTLAARKPPLTGRDEDITCDIVLPVTYGDTELYAKTMLEHGVKTEFELYHEGQFWVIDNLLRKKLVKPPLMIDFVMGFQTGSYPTPANMLQLVQNLPPQSYFTIIALGQHQAPLTTLAIILGGHVRVGMEDNIFIEKGKLCDSGAQFVEKTVRIAKELGREVATPAVARKMLGLSEKPSQY